MIIAQDLKDKIKKVGEVLQLAAQMSLEYYNKPLILTYSGGKDSDVLVLLGMKFLQPGQYEVLNSHTTVDAPETVYHIRRTFDRLQTQGVKTTVMMPLYKGEPTTMWKLIVQKQFPPTRTQRYCCQVLKEASTPRRAIATGVRMDESQIRRGRDVFSISGNTKEGALYYSLDHAKEVYDEAQWGLGDAFDCRLIKEAKANKELVTNPIYEWTTADVWDYLKICGLKHNPLYDMGYLRVGCIGCPLGGGGRRCESFMISRNTRAHTCGRSTE